MQNREPTLKPGDYSLGQVHEFVGAFSRAGGTAGLLQLTQENRLLMKRVLSCWRAGGTTYQFSNEEEEALNLFGMEHFIHPGLAELAGWETASGDSRIRYSEETLKRCALENQNGDRITDFWYIDGGERQEFKRDWRLVYITGQSLNSILAHYQHASVRVDLSQEKFAAERIEPGYYLISYIPLCGGGKQYREFQDQLIAALGEKYDRVPSAMLCEAAISISKTFGARKAEMDYTCHWGSELCQNGHFLNVNFKADPHPDHFDAPIEIRLQARTPGMSINRVFVASHGVCIYRKHDF